MPTEFLEDPALLMSHDDWLEMQNLREEISYNPANVVFHEMERFTQLLVLSLQGKGDSSHAIHSYNKK
jgi:hypothetical protein